MHGQRVNIRFNPLLLDRVLIFTKDKYVCTAYPMEYSSMLDFDLASRKIAEKASGAKNSPRNLSASRLSRLISGNSTVPEAERVAALIEEDRSGARWKTRNSIALFPNRKSTSTSPKWKQNKRCR